MSPILGFVTPAVRALVDAGVAHVVAEYGHDPTRTDFGIEAAEALGVDPDSVFKTLVVLVDGAESVVVVPVTRSVSMKAVAAAFGGKRAEMCPPDRAERVTGFVVGGISPFGQRRSLRTVVDETVVLVDRVYVSGGRRGVDVGVSPDDLVAVTGAVLADIAV